MSYHELTIPLVGISLYATYLNTNGDRRCFTLWLFSNLCWCTYDIYMGAFPQALLFFTYALLAIRGLRRWKKSA